MLVVTAFHCCFSILSASKRTPLCSCSRCSWLFDETEFRYLSFRSAPPCREAPAFTQTDRVTRIPARSLVDRPILSSGYVRRHAQLPHSADEVSRVIGFISSCRDPTASSPGQLVQH